MAETTTIVYRVVIMTDPGKEVVKYYFESEFLEIKELILKAANHKANIRLLQFNDKQLKAVGLKVETSKTKEPKKV